jgi:hypothetical protein
MTTKNRARLARQNAGLSVRQACELLEIDREVLVAAEESDEAFEDLDVGDLKFMIDIYGVNRAWLLGEVPRHDYAAVKQIAGADSLTFRDRDMIAELMASRPRGDRR